MPSSTFRPAMEGRSSTPFRCDDNGYWTPLPLNKNRDGKAPPAGGSVERNLSYNTGRPYDPEDVSLANEIIRQVEAEEQSNHSPTVDAPL